LKRKHEAGRLMARQAGTPELHSVQDPGRLGWKPIVKIDHYHVGADVILKDANKIEGER
jgi:hypothetical protein